MNREYQLKIKAVIIVSLFSVIAISKVSAFDIHIAPVLYVDETEERNRNTNNAQSELIDALRSVETGVVLQFNTFEYSNRTVMKTFFEMDDPDNYDRMINDITMKILKYVREKFNLEIITERKNVTQLKIPVIIGYWTPLGSDWIDVMLGTVAAGTGFVFIPTDNLFMIRGMPCYLSTGLEIKYRLGIGDKERYEAYNHTLYMMMPLRFHMPFTPRHQIYMGLGYIYFLEFFSFADKYEDSKNFLFNNMGTNGCIGYRFEINNTLSIFLRNDIDVLFNEHSLITYAAMLGIDIKVYEKEIKKRW